MKISRKSSTLGIVRSRSMSPHDFEIFLHLPQYKLSSLISQLWHKVGSSNLVCVFMILIYYKAYEKCHA